MCYGTPCRCKYGKKKLKNWKKKFRFSTRFSTTKYDFFVQKMSHFLSWRAWMQICDKKRFWKFEKKVSDFLPDFQPPNMNFLSEKCPIFCHRCIRKIANSHSRPLKSLKSLNLTNGYPNKNNKKNNNNNNNKVKSKPLELFELAGKNNLFI
jgi:hypothetical protein